MPQMRPSTVTVVASYNQRAALMSKNQITVRQVAEHVIRNEPHSRYVVQIIRANDTDTSTESAGFIDLAFETTAHINNVVSTLETVGKKLFGKPIRCRVFILNEDL